MAMISAGFVGTGFLGPDRLSFIVLVVSMASVYGGFAALNVLAPSLLVDVVRFSLKDIEGLSESEGLYFSLYTFVSKSSVAFGSSLGLLLVGFFGFDAAEKMQSDSAVWGLHLSMIFFPVFFISLSTCFVGLIPSYDA